MVDTAASWIGPIRFAPNVGRRAGTIVSPGQEGQLGCEEGKVDKAGGLQLPSFSAKQWYFSVIILP